MAVAISYQTLKFACECGKVPKWLAHIGLTSNHHLVVHWRCTQCRRQMYVVKPLSECWGQCPDHDPSPEHDEADVLDLRFLRSLKIKYPDE